MRDGFETDLQSGNASRHDADKILTVDVRRWQRLTLPPRTCCCFLLCGCSVTTKLAFSCWIIIFLYKLQCNVHFDTNSSRESSGASARHRGGYLVEQSLCGPLQTCLVGDPPSGNMFCNYMTWCLPASAICLNNTQHFSPLGHSLWSSLLPPELPCYLLYYGLLYYTILYATIRYYTIL